jgi:hypothetical protein
MKKLLLSAALLGSAVVAGNAVADVIPPTSGNGELTLFVYNTVTQTSYARGLGVTLDSILTEAQSGGTYTGAAGSPQQVAFSFPTIAADGNLTSFLATGSASDFVWGIQAADNVGSNLATTPRRLGFSSVIDPTILLVPSNATLTTATNSQNSAVTNLNNNLPDVSGSSVVGSGSAGGLWGISPGMQTLYSTGLNNAAGLGTASHLYLVTSSGGANGAAGRIFQAVDIQLDTLAAGGALRAVVTSPVPLPAAFWLFGSGLMGMFGIGRRRRHDAAAAVAA